jgi:hypothetical protein
MTQCAQCGRPLVLGGRFCEYCGAAVVSSPPTDPPGIYERPAPVVTVEPPPADPGLGAGTSAQPWLPAPTDPPAEVGPQETAPLWDAVSTGPDAAASYEPGVDGHPEDGEPLPPAPPRRTWARRGRRLAVAGVLVLALGMLLLGAGLGWTARSVTASPPDTESTVQVVEAPRAGEAVGVVLPDVRGLETVVAQQAFADAGVDSAAVTVLETASALPQGTVVSQEPVGGTTGAAQVTVYVAVAGAIPDLIGTDGSAAIQTLVELGVNAAVTEVYDPARPEGIVLALDPPAGSPLTEDVTVTVAGPAGSVYLDELDAQNGCSTGSADVNGTTYQHALSCSTYSSEQTASYLLDRRTVQLTGALGVLDTSDSDYVGTVVIRGDGRTLFSTELRYGSTVPFTVPTAGVLRLEIEYARVEFGTTSPSGSVVVADPRVIGSPADVDLLADE